MLLMGLKKDRVWQRLMLLRPPDVTSQEGIGAAMSNRNADMHVVPDIRHHLLTMPTATTIDSILHFDAARLSLWSIKYIQSSL